MSSAVPSPRGFDADRRRAVLGIGATLGTALGAPAAFAQGLSKRPITIFVAQTPGTTPDLLARVLAPRLAQRWEQPVVVENRAGASGIIGMEAVAKAPPDGHTILVNVATTLALPLFYRTVPFDTLASFTPITYIGSSNFALTVPAARGIETVGAFLAAARAKPGQLHYGTPGVGTHHHLCMELLRTTTGIDVVHVPYKGAAGAVTDLLGGRLDAMFLPIQVATGLAAEGKVRILGGTLRTRQTIFPNIPSLAEQGIAGFDVDPWYAVWGPPGLAQEMVRRHHDAVSAIYTDPDVRASLEKQGFVPRPQGPDALKTIAQEEFAMWARVVKERGIRAE